MARIKQEYKRNYIWLQNWSRVPKTSEINLEGYFKWLLKYYPKKSRDLNLLTQTSQRIESYNAPVLINPLDSPEELPQEKFNLKEARNRVIRRYKQDYYRHFKIDTDTKDKIFNKPVRNAQTIVLSQPKGKMRISELFLKKILVNLVKNVNLKTLEISNHKSFNSPQFLIRCLKYSRSAKSLTIKNVPFLPLRLWKYLIVDCHPNLESFTIEGELAHEYFLDGLKTLTQVLEIVLGMKSLKKFQFDFKIPANYEFGLKKIPFYKLKNKQLSYDIRIPSSSVKLEISEINSPILKNIDFLAVNNKDLSRGDYYLWDEIANHYLACQEQVKNRLFLNVSTTYNISSLLQSCSNISVLDLSLAESYHTLDLSDIPKLYNLRHIFIAIKFYKKFSGELFSNLAQALQGNPVLSSIALELQNSQVFKNAATSDAFFGACLNTVTTLSVNFVEDKKDGIKNFYQSIRQLKNLQNLHIQMVGVPSKEEIELRFDHCSNLAKFLGECQSLEELTVKSPIRNIDKILLDFLAFRSLKRLRKLTLDFGFLLIPQGQVQHLKNLSSLTHLEFYMNGIIWGFHEDEGWCSFFEAIKKNRELLVIKLKDSNLSHPDANEAIEIAIERSLNSIETSLFSIQRCSRRLFRELPSLKAVLLEIQESSEITIFQGRCRWSEIEDILAEEPLREPKIKLEKISY